MSPLGKFPTTPDDPLITKMLLEQCYDGDLYTCPKCDHTEADPRAFADHIQQHLDEFITKGPIPVSRTPPPPGYDLTKEPPVRPFPQEGGSPPPPQIGIKSTKP